MTDAHRTRRSLAPLAALGGFAIGLVAWIVLVAALSSGSPEVADSVQQAREMGLVSFTVLEGYDKAQELHAWLLGCLIVPISTWAIWVAVRPPPEPERAGRRRSKERRTEAEPDDQGDDDDADDEQGEIDKRKRKDRRGPPTWFPRLGLAVTALAVLLRPGFLRGPSPWGSFGLLGEEGVYLGAVQALRAGRVLYVDLEFPYGPLMIHPLNLWLRITGDTVVSARTWVLLLNVAGLLAAAAVIRLLVGPKRGAWAAFGVALAMAVLAPMFLPNLNAVLLRPALAFLPAALIFAAGRRVAFARLDAGDEEPDPRALWRPRPWRCPLIAAGLLLAAGGLFSFEVGVAGAVGLAVALLLVRPPLRAAGRIAIGLLAVGLTVLLPMHLSGSLAGLFDQGQRMLTLPALGYQALPYPDPLALFVDGAGKLGSYPPETGAVLAWAVLPPLVIWLGLGLGLCGVKRSGSPGPGGALLLVAVISAVLFRAALGRSDLYHLWFYGAVPLVLLATLLLLRAWDVSIPEFRPLVPCVGALVVVLLVSLGSERQVRFPDSEEVRLSKEAGLDGALVTRPVHLRRTGRMRLLPRLAEQIEAVTARAAELPAADGVYFYPSEATFYYLTDRRPPSRYLWAYDAATPAMQARAVLDLELDRPRWMFRSTDTFEIDHIAQDRLVPRLESYLQERYRPVEILPGAVLLERVGR